MVPPENITPVRSRRRSRSRRRLVGVLTVAGLLVPMVALLAPAGATAATGDITVSPAVATVQVDEGTRARVGLRASVAGGGALGATVTVDWSTGRGTATAGADYTAASGHVVFPAGAPSGTVEYLSVATKTDRSWWSRSSTSPRPRPARPGFPGSSLPACA